MTAETGATKYWSCNEDEEELTHTSIGDAVEYYLDDIEPHEWPRVLHVYGWRESTIPESFLAGSTVERALEALDEEFGDPDGGYSEPTQAMKEAEAVFIRAILAEYPCWLCERTSEVEIVDVAAWVREFSPDWLDGPETQKALARLDAKAAADVAVTE